MPVPTRAGVSVRVIVLMAASMLATVATASRVDAQRLGVARAFDLERRGSYADAVQAYGKVLADNPDDVTALLGMERSLTPLGRISEIIPLVRNALAQDSTTGAIYAIGVRAWAQFDQPDSLEVRVIRWAAQHPDEETPYREWGRALLRRQQRDAAHGGREHQSRRGGRSNRHRVVYFCVRHRSPFGPFYEAARAECAGGTTQAYPSVSPPDRSADLENRSYSD